MRRLAIYLLHLLLQFATWGLRKLEPPKVVARKRLVVLNNGIEYVRHVSMETGTQAKTLCGTLITEEVQGNGRICSICRTSLTELKKATI